MLADSDSETNDLHTLTINEHFAKAFEYKKEREELAKLKEKYGSDYSESGPSDANDSEDSEDTKEDSDGEELTPAVDAAILRTLARIKKKDPAIYEDGRCVFDEEHTRTQDKAPIIKPKTKEKSKPLTIREAALASALAEAGPRSRSPSPESRQLTHTEEQYLLRSETRAVFHDAVNSEAQGDEDDLLILRSRTRDEIELEEEEYRAFLEREVSEDLRNLITVATNEAVGVDQNVEDMGNSDKRDEDKKKKKGKREHGKERKEIQEKDKAQDKNATKKHDESREEADQEFLLNYVFNRGWIDRSNRRVPTYNEIVGSSSKQSKRSSTKPQCVAGSDEDADQEQYSEQGETHGAMLSDENSFDDLADAFETSYNFRFEEPGGALITSFPRNLPSVRRESTTRKDARSRKKARQEAEKQAVLEARREDIRRERALVEAAVAGEYPDEDTTNKKRSKKQQRKEDLARLKALRANELRRKLEKVSSEGGLGSIGDEALAHLDLDANWDPMKHDAQMAELYGGDNGIVDDVDIEKPTWDDDINIDDINPPANTKSKVELKKQRKKEKKKHRNADESVGVDVDEMDADLDMGTGADWDDWHDDGEEWRVTEEEQKRKVDAYMDEVVNRLGFSGITSHMPTRFHYTSTTPENYGLTPSEMLLATDAELNSYVGLKKLAPYRVYKDGKTKKDWDPKRFQRLREFREALHGRVGSRYGGPWSLDVGTNSNTRPAGAQEEKKKRKGKKERTKLKATQGEHDAKGVIGNNSDAEPEVARKPVKRKCDPDTNPLSHETLAGEVVQDKEDGVRKKRRRRRRHRGGSGADELGETMQEPCHDSSAALHAR